MSLPARSGENGRPHLRFRLLVRLTAVQMSLRLFRNQSVSSHSWTRSARRRLNTGSAASIVPLLLALMITLGCARVEAKARRRRGGRAATGEILWQVPAL